MGTSTDEDFVIDEMRKVQEQYVEYTRLAQLSFVASQSYVSDGPQVDTERHPVGLVVKTNF